MAPRPEPFQASLVTAIATEGTFPLAMGIGLEYPSPTPVLTSSFPEAIVLLDPMSTGVILQGKIFECGM